MPRPKGSKNRNTLLVENVDEKIAEVESEIARLNAELKAKKTELKTLARAKLNAEKAAAEKKAEEDKKTILAAAEASGKTLEEILDFLK